MDALYTRPTEQTVWIRSDHIIQCFNIKYSIESWTLLTLYNNNKLIPFVKGNKKRGIHRIFMVF